jgi:predicted nucleic acid-binding protein
MIVVSNATPIISLACIDNMIEKGRWISHKVYKDVLKFCGEK